MLIVEDRTTGQSWTFPTDKEGYRNANAMLDWILSQHHDPGNSEMDRIRAGRF